MKVPVVALVGRPNVGKSALFNRLVGGHTAIVSEEAGTTRDRHFGRVEWAGTQFWLVDTGGLADDPHLPMDLEIRRQVMQAIEEAEMMLLVVDARAGLHPSDSRIVDILRDSGRPWLLVANKVDNPATTDYYEFYALGAGEPLPVSATNGRQSGDLLDAMVEKLPTIEDEIGEGLRVAVIGRPNVGKSSLVNRLLGEDRLIVSDVAGTTRDPIRVALERDGKRYTLIDTAGIRRKARVEGAVEKFSVIKTLQSISAAQVVVLMIDARENLADQDLTLIGYALDEGRALVIAINKWDGLDKYQRDECMRALDRRLVFVPWAKQVHISALHGSGLRELMRAVVRAHSSATRVLVSSDLTKTLEQAYEAYQPPLVQGHAPRLRFAHPGGTNPPTIVIHGTRTKHIAPAYQRYLENFFRKRYRLEGTPVRIAFREGENPYAGRKKVLTKEQEQKARRRVSELIKRTR